MARFYLHIVRCLLLMAFVIVSMQAPAQKKLGLEVDKWAKLLSANKQNELNSLGSLTQQLIAVDSVRALGFLDSLKNSPYAKGYYFKTYYAMVKADFLFAKFAGYDKFKDRRANALLPIKQQMMQLHADALDAAYHIEEDMNTGWVSFYSARRMRHFGEIAWAVMYSKNGVDLFEKVKYRIEPPVYTDLADLLYQVKEYDEAILYAKKGLNAWKNPEFERDYKDAYKQKIKALNTIGNSYYEQKLPDSAMPYLQQALRLATIKKDSLLTANVQGNIGKLLFGKKEYDSAYTLFKNYYLQSKDDSLYHEAAHALQWMAKLNLVMGNTPAAKEECRQALALLALWPNGPYMRDCYYTLTQVHRASGNLDSAFYFNDLYQHLHDSLEKEVATSSLTISKAKLNDEMSRFNIQKLNGEKEKEMLWRNIIIVSILTISLIALLIINRQRLKEKLNSEKAEQEKQLMAQEMEAANEQLKMFTANIIEKTSLVEKLEAQIKGREATADQQALMNELSQQTILTEDDWIRFRTMFEKLHPGFFINLKEKFWDITVAEQRMAALTRLRLTSRQMASMLGISVDSVHKSRQRLRQRFQVGTDIRLDELVANL